MIKTNVQSFYIENLVQSLVYIIIKSFLQILVNWDFFSHILWEIICNLYIKYQLFCIFDLILTKDILLINSKTRYENKREQESLLLDQHFRKQSRDQNVYQATCFFSWKQIFFKIVPKNLHNLNYSIMYICMTNH